MRSPPPQALTLSRWPPRYARWVTWGLAAERLLTASAAGRTAGLRVAEVAGTLHQIAEAQGPGSQGRKLALLTGLLGQATPLEARYLCAWSPVGCGWESARRPSRMRYANRDVLVAGDPLPMNTRPPATAGVLVSRRRPSRATAAGTTAAGLNHEHPGGILFRTQAVAFCLVPRWGHCSPVGGRYTWSCRAARSARHPVKVEVTGSNPVRTAQPGESLARSGSSVGMSVRLKSGRSAVRPRP